MSDECCFDPQVILDDIPAAIASGALTINNASRIGMSREQFIIAASQSPMGTFVSEEGCCFDIDAILADIPGAIDAGVLNQNNAHRIGLSRGGFAVILAMIQGGGGGGGDYLPLAGGTMDENAIVTLDNNSQWRQSTPDIGIAGSEGFSIVCGVGYEYKFAAGYLFVLNNTSTQVRQVLYAPTSPSVNDDITLGYVVGTTWETADGIKYICTDNTDGAAGWVLVSDLNPGVIYVRTNGNDSIAEIGNPARPFQTIAAALAARTMPLTKPTSMVFGRGTFDGDEFLNIAGTPASYYGFCIQGAGLDATVINMTKTYANGSPDGVDYENGGNAGNVGSLSLNSDLSITVHINITCGSGGAGSTPFDPVGGGGYNGGGASMVAGWSIIGIHGSFLITEGIGGAAGGPGNDSPNNDGSPGNSTTIDPPSISYCSLATNSNLPTSSIHFSFIDGVPV